MWVSSSHQGFNTSPLIVPLTPVTSPRASTPLLYWVFIGSGARLANKKACVLTGELGLCVNTMKCVLFTPVFSSPLAGLLNEHVDVSLLWAHQEIVSKTRPSYSKEGADVPSL